MHAAMASFAASNHLTTTFPTPRFPPSCRSHRHTIISSSLRCRLPPSPSSSDHRDHPNLFKTLAISSAAATIIFFTTPLCSLSSGQNNGPGGGGGGGGGNWFSGGDGSFWSRLLSLFPSIAADDDFSSAEWHEHGLPANYIFNPRMLRGSMKYKISEISYFDQKSGSFDDFYYHEFQNTYIFLRSGGIYKKWQLLKELETLKKSGLFQKVDMKGKANPDGTISLTISYTETTWRSPENVRCINVALIPPTEEPIELDPDATKLERLQYSRALKREIERTIEMGRPCILPASVQTAINDMVKGQERINSRVLVRIRNCVRKWYFEKGYHCAKFVNFRNLGTKELVCMMSEGDITELSILFLDELGHAVEGKTQIPVVEREIPEQLRPGHLYNRDVSRQAVKKIKSLGLFSKIIVGTRRDEKKEGGVVVEVKLTEPPKFYTSDTILTWGYVPAPGGRPTFTSVQPGATAKFEFQNVKGLNRKIYGQVATRNLFGPEDDLVYKIGYQHPYLDGVDNPRNRSFKLVCFNSRNQSPVFTRGSFGYPVPPILVHRAGLTARITEMFTTQSKLIYGLVIQEIQTCDERKRLCTNGRKQYGDQIRADGPPTTLSGTGTDWVSFLQANITRDNTKFVNGAEVGKRIVFQLDQGLGIGSKFPFFNRHQLTVTEFFQLKSVKKGAGKPPPPVLVLHGRYAGCVGDLPSYEAFTLGGPHSVRGYNMGEIGAARRSLELAAEIRMSVKGTRVYAFVEHGNDLGSSKLVTGNPTRFYWKSGHGSSFGLGIKLGLGRVEYTINANTRTGAWFFHFGERF